MTEKNQTPQPVVIVDDMLSASLEVDPVVIAQTMQELGISNPGITNTTLHIDDKRHFLYKGSQTPKSFDRVLRNPSEVNEGEGSVIRVSTNIRGRELDAETMNQTLVHELEHVAQTDRKDTKMKIGNLAIWGLAAAGLVVGNYLGKKSGSKITRAVSPVIGFAIGHQMGYRIAPHERQARARAKEVKTTAILRK